MAETVDLCNKYRPATLKDVYGQDSVSYFFRSVVNNPEESPRYYGLFGPYGTGKSTIARAFAHDLIGPEYKNTPNYIEIDSSQKEIADNFDVVRDLIFQEVPGWKVVLLDESHLLPTQTSQQLLKILEDFVGRVFIFFATTNPEQMFPPILSRLHKFQLSLFTPDQCKIYASDVLGREGIAVSDKALAVAALNCQGHLRDCLKQCELMLFQGEEFYLKSFSAIWSSIEDYFFSDKDKSEVIQQMYTYHPIQLKMYFSYYFRDQILNPKSSNYNKVCPVQVLPKLFAKYLQLIGSIKEPDDFFSFLFVFAQVLGAVKNV